MACHHPRCRDRHPCACSSGRLRLPGVRLGSLRQGIDAESKRAVLFWRGATCLQRLCGLSSSSSLSPCLSSRGHKTLPLKDSCSGKSLRWRMMERSYPDRRFSYGCGLSSYYDTVGCQRRWVHAAGFLRPLCSFGARLWPSSLTRPTGQRVKRGTSKIKHFVVHFHPCKNKDLQATKITHLLLTYLQRYCRDRQWTTEAFRQA